MIIYLTVIIGMVIALAIKRYHEDLSLNLLSEIIGAAFTLFVIDVLLVKSKTRRWLIVQEHVDYLIARTVNRLRDGLSTRVFAFQPRVEGTSSEVDILRRIRSQREVFLNELLALPPEEFAAKFSRKLFSQESFVYFNEKADDIWDLLNMKYSEYLAPPLVHLLMELHTNLKDICSHIRQYKKSERFPEEKEYYHQRGIEEQLIISKRWFVL